MLLAKSAISSVEVCTDFAVLFISLLHRLFLWGRESATRILFLTCTSKFKPMFIIDEFIKSCTDVLTQFAGDSKTPIAMMDEKGAGFPTRASVCMARGISSTSDTLKTHI